MPAPVRTFIRLAVLGTLGVLATLIAAATAAAQRGARLPDELRGSKESVQRMWDFAQSHQMPFYLTPTNINDAIREGRLMALTGDSAYELTRGVGFSYATREARQFVIDFAPQYLAACGTPLTVTSAARPISRQPRNSNPYSVHPTGIAVDLRRPRAGPCLTWLRHALAELEQKGFVEATEERHPVHLHVAVLTEPGRVAALPQLSSSSYASSTRSGVAPERVALSTPAIAAMPAPQRVSSSAPTRASSNAKRGNGDTDRTRTYRVREGDTLWDVARKNGVSVTALARANHRSTRGVLRPGVTLRLPESKSN